MRGINPSWQGRHISRERAWYLLLQDSTELQCLATEL